MRKKINQVPATIYPARLSFSGADKRMFYTRRRRSLDCKDGCCFGRSTRCFYQHFLGEISTNRSLVTLTALVFSSSVPSLFLQEEGMTVTDLTNFSTVDTNPVSQCEITVSETECIFGLGCEVCMVVILVLTIDAGWKHLQGWLIGMLHDSSDSLIFLGDRMAIAYSGFGPSS